MTLSKTTINEKKPIDKICLNLLYILMTIEESTLDLVVSAD